jgi:hypothetical protein
MLRDGVWYEDWQSSVEVVMMSFVVMMKLYVLYGYGDYHYSNVWNLFVPGSEQRLGTNKCQPQP